MHAGINPGCALETQVAEDLLWIREAFLPIRTICRIPWSSGIPPNGKLVLTFRIKSGLIPASSMAEN